MFAFSYIAEYSILNNSLHTVAELKRSRGGPRTLNLFSAFLLGQIGAHREQKKIPRPGRFLTSSVVVCYVISLAYVLTGASPGFLGQCISVTYWQGERWTTWPETHGPRRVALAQGLGNASSFISGRAREKAQASTVGSVLKLVYWPERKIP